MTSELFFENLKKQYSEGLPFVAYRKPLETCVKAFLQKDTSLIITTDFTESGFVFAPFDNHDDAILIPLASSKSAETEIIGSNTIQQPNLHEDILDSDTNAHIKLVQKGIETINSGKLKKVVLSRKEVLSIGKKDAIAIFQRLLNTYNSAFVYIWFHPKVGMWLGATPESLISLKNNRLSTMSLAGTKLSNDDKDIIWGKKEKEEQQLVTDFIIKQLDLSMSDMTISEARSVKAGHLVHLETKVSGVLKDTGLFEVLRKLHPTPAICGLPRTVAKDFILENENYDREFYTGFLGELNLLESTKRNTNRRNTENNAYGSILKVSNLYVNLRCMQIKNGKAHIYVGGGITKDSIPENEWYETINKANTMKKVL
jgi:isochorismate synthase